MTRQLPAFYSHRASQLEGPHIPECSIFSSGQVFRQMTTLLVILLALLTNNVEELQAVLALGGGDDAEPVTELLLLEELLGEVLEVAAGELLVGDDFDAAVAEVAHGDVVTEVAGAAVDLDALLQEGGELAGVEDAVVGWLLRVDDVLELGVSGWTAF